MRETGCAGPLSPRGNLRTFVAATSPPALWARTPRAPCAERGRGGLLCPGRPERRIPGAAGTTRPGAAGRGQGSPGAPVCAVSPPPWDPEDDCNVPGSSVHVIFHAKSRRGLPFPPPADPPWSSIYPASYRCLLCLALAGRVCTTEPPGKPSCAPSTGLFPLRKIQLGFLVYLFAFNSEYHAFCLNLFLQINMYQQVLAAMQNIKE